MRTENQIHSGQGFGDGTPSGARDGRLIKENWLELRTSRHLNDEIFLTLQSRHCTRTLETRR